MKKKLFLLAKLLVSLALIAYLLSQAGLAEVFASIRSAEPLYLLLAFGLLYVGKLLTAFRWQALLAAQGIKIPLPPLIASLFVGQFFNSFLPTTVGGDAVRAYDTAVQSKETAKSVTTVFVDRLIGVLALVLLALAALIVGYINDADIHFYVLPVLAVFFICAMSFFIVFNNNLMHLADRLLRLLRLVKVADKVYKAYRSVHQIKHDKRTLWIAFLVSLLLQVNVIYFYYLIAGSIGLGVPVLYFFLIVPVALTVLILPFSINGIGIREGVFVVLLSGVGVPDYQAIAFSWIALGLTLTQGIIGGILFAFRGIHLRKKVREETAV